MQMEIISKFSEDRFFATYKTIRNNFRKYDTEDFIWKCLNYLHSPVKNELEGLKRNPWLVLLLIKWVIADEQSFRYIRSKP